MSDQELFFLIVACGAFAAFGVALATATFTYRRSLKSMVRSTRAGGRRGRG